MAKLFFKETDMHTRLFDFSCIAGVGCSLFAFIAAITSELPFISVISSFGCFICMLVICIYCLRKTDKKKNSLIIVIALNFMLFPGLFFTSGGVQSGMPLYFLLGIYVCSVVLTKRTKWVMLFLAICNYAVILWTGFQYPEWVVPIKEEMRTSDVISSFVIVSACVAAITYIVISEYEKGHEYVLHMNEILENTSNVDALTGLYNRRYLNKELKNWQECHNPNETLAIIFLDIDDFKKINDIYGHQEGDNILIKISDVIKKAVGEKGIVSRYGGEEIIVVVYGSNVSEVWDIAECIRTETQDTVTVGDDRQKISISGGISSYKQGMSIDELINDADRKLYQAKKAGKNRIVK